MGEEKRVVVGREQWFISACRLIKRSEARRHLWSRLIKGLRRGMRRVAYASFVLPFLHALGRLKCASMEAACQHGATQVSWAANFAQGTFSLFYFSRRGSFVAPFPKVGTITWLFSWCCSGPCWTSATPSTRNAAHLPLFSASHSSQSPERGIGHNKPVIDFFSVSTRWPRWMQFICVTFNWAWKARNVWYFIFGILDKTHVQ